MRIMRGSGLAGIASVLLRSVVVFVIDNTLSIDKYPIALNLEFKLFILSS